MTRSFLLLASFATLPAWGCSKTPDPESAPTVNAAATSQPAVTDCGNKGQPDCPLQGWMKDSVRAYMNAGDHERLASALDQLASHMPAGYSGWEMSAQRAAAAARVKDTTAIKAECKSCHDEFRERFRAEMRGARLF